MTDWEAAKKIWNLLPASARVDVDLNYGREGTTPNPVGRGRMLWLRAVERVICEAWKEPV